MAKIGQDLVIICVKLIFTIYSFDPAPHFCESVESCGQNKQIMDIKYWLFGSLRQNIHTKGLKHVVSEVSSLMFLGEEIIQWNKTWDMFVWCQWWVDRRGGGGWWWPAGILTRTCHGPWTPGRPWHVFINTNYPLSQAATNKLSKSMRWGWI